jgi:hypothetical protein
MNLIRKVEAVGLIKTYLESNKKNIVLDDGGMALSNLDGIPIKDNWDNTFRGVGRLTIPELQGILNTIDPTSGYKVI